MTSNPAKAGPDKQLNDMLKFIELSCIGGTAGYPVSIVLRDFPPDVVSGICARISGRFVSEEVAEVSSQIDVQRLESQLSNLRVVFVLPSGKSRQYFEHLCWKIEQRRGKRVSLPVIITVYRTDIEQNPGTTVVFRGDPDLSTTAGNWWLTDEQRTPICMASELLSGTTQNVSRLLRAIYSAIKTASLSLLDIRILESLLIGHVLSKPPAEQKTLMESAQALLPAYREVRQCLLHSMLRKVCEPFDDLTHLMLGRANKFLAVRSGHAIPVKANVGARAGANSTINNSTQTESTNCPTTITFRELVNLGNQHSSEFKTILEHFGSESKTLNELGIRVGSSLANARSPPSQQRRTSDDAADVTCWSFKQVRTRFERLRQLRLIDVRRKVANGPIEYLLAEELRNDRSRFSHLPEYEDVEKNLRLS